MNFHATCLGDSLCQKVLDDELVAIGRPGDSPSFQILHGIYCLEQAILDLKRRDCNFEIVFFECAPKYPMPLNIPDLVIQVISMEPS